MDTKSIQTILKEALEVQVPSSQVDLWPAVRSALKIRNPQPSGQVRSPNTRRIPGLVYVILILIALLVGISLTPPGRSLAQSVLHFFVPAEGRTFPLSPSQILTGEQGASTTAQATQPLISVAEAEALAGFEAVELPSEPEGFIYLGARLYGDTISIEYQAKGGGGHLIIQQSPHGYIQSDWDMVPADAIVPVKIGEMDGEFAPGTFVVYPGETQATWNPEAPILRLRWVQEDIWFQLTKFGDVETIEYLNLAGLVDLAERLIRTP